MPLLKSESSSSLQTRKIGAAAAAADFQRTNSNSSFTKPPTGAPKKELASKLENLKALKSRFRDQLPDRDSNVHYRIGSKSPKSSYREGAGQFTSQQQALYEQLQQKQLLLSDNGAMFTETSPRGGRRPPRLEPTILPNKLNEQIASARQYLNNNCKKAGVDENKYEALKSPDVNLKASSSSSHRGRGSGQNIIRSPFTLGGMKTPKSFKPVLESSDKRNSFINPHPLAPYSKYGDTGRIVANGSHKRTTAIPSRGLGAMRSIERGSCKPTTFLRGFDDRNY